MINFVEFLKITFHWFNLGNDPVRSWRKAQVFFLFVVNAIDVAYLSTKCSSVVGPQALGMPKGGQKILLPFYSIFWTIQKNGLCNKFEIIGHARAAQNAHRLRHWLSTKGKYSCHSDANLNMEFVTQECYNKLLMYPINGTSHESYGTDSK